jgi:hypothetical protein
MYTLEVGTVLYSTGGYGNRMQKVIITRVTKTQAIKDINAGTSLRFDRDLPGLWVGVVWVS